MPEHDPIPPEVDAYAKQAVDAAIKIHRRFGPGLLERVYHTCMCHELRLRGIRVESKVKLPLEYEGLIIDEGLELDIRAGGCLVLELKAVEKMIPLFEAQTLTYLKLSGHRLALLMNFNVPLMKDGIQRIIL